MASDNKPQLSGIISLIFSGLAWVLFCFPQLLFLYLLASLFSFSPIYARILITSLFAIIGIVFGAIGVVKARKIHRKLALAGLILGVIFFPALFIVILLAMASL